MSLPYGLSTGEVRLHEADLPDLHVRVDRDRQVRDVGELEREVAFETCIDEARGAVDQESQASQARLPLETCDEVVGKLHVLQGRAEHELARMQDEGLLLLHLDDLGEVIHRRFHVDERVPSVVERPEEAIDVEIHGAGLHVLVIEGIDADIPSGNGSSDIPVGEDHRGVTI